jgi:hypothetical protein
MVIEIEQHLVVVDPPFDEALPQQPLKPAQTRT